MRASRSAPADYVAAGAVVLDGNHRLKSRLNLVSMPLLLLAGCVLLTFAGAVRPELTDYNRGFAGPVDALLWIGLFILTGLILVPATVIVVHEAVHGLFFWLYTRSRPRFGFKGWYAYASAPGWYLSRNAFLVVLLGPVVTMTAAAIGLALVLPPLGVLAVVFGASMNVAASVGDFYISARLLTAPASAVVEDRPTGVAWFVAPGR